MLESSMPLAWFFLPDSLAFLFFSWLAMLMNKTAGEFGEEVVWMSLCIIQLTSWLLTVNWKISNHFLLILASWVIWPAICYQSTFGKSVLEDWLKKKEKKEMETISGKLMWNRRKSFSRSAQLPHQVCHWSIPRGTSENPRLMTIIKQHRPQCYALRLLRRSRAATASYFSPFGNIPKSKYLEKPKDFSSGVCHCPTR